MKKFEKINSGFTLVEIIVVLIIIGILAAIALPSLFTNIQKSKSSQALTEMDWMKTAIESCLAQQSTVSPNAGQCTLTGQNILTTGNGWTYTIPGIAAQGPLAGGSIGASGTFVANNLGYSIQASDGSNTIVISRSSVGTWTCSVGTASPYTGLC